MQWGFDSLGPLTNWPLDPAAGPLTLAVCAVVGRAGVARLVDRLTGERSHRAPNPLAARLGPVSNGGVAAGEDEQQTKCLDGKLVVG